MARKTIVNLTDDLTGGTADVTVSFGLDGAVYEIDLNSKNAAALEKALAPYVAAARRVRRNERARRTSRYPSRREETAAIREWAKASGYALAERGRIPAAVIEAYEHAPEA